MSKKPSRKTTVRKLDKLVSQIVIARDGKCIVCSTTQNLTCGHLFSRVAYSTRWDLDNCYAQCLSCNLKHEYDPYPMTEAVKRLLWERYNGSRVIGNDLVVVDNKVDDLHRKYVTPHKYKNFELEHLVEVFEKKLKEVRD